MKTRFFLSFFVLGFVSIITQVLVLRELMVTFYGNELFLGLALGFWLFWTASGSFWGRKLTTKKAFVFNLIFLAFFLPLSIVFIRFIKTLSPSGTLIDFPKAIGLTFLCLAPLCFSLGFFFPTAFFNFKKSQLAQLASRAYLVETLGLALGGIGFNFYLTKFPPLALSLTLSAAIFFLTFLYIRRKLFSASLFILTMIALYKAPFGEQKTLAFQFPGLVESKNSIYGRITVTKKNNQFNFFESGTLTGISQKTEDCEYLIHPILLQHPNPKKILMIGGGLNGSLGEILKYQPERITSVELDPILVKTTKKFLDPQLVKVIEDKRVNLVLTDPRKFLKESQEKYDLVIVNLPPPSTALINRLYTCQAFAEIKKILNPQGIFALNLYLPTDYLSGESQNLAASIYETLNHEFRHILLLPEYTLLFLASSEPALTTDYQILAQRLKDHQIQTDFISPAYIKNRLNNDRMMMFTQAVKQNGRLNSDFHPIAYFFQTLFWQSYFGGRWPALLKVLEKFGLLFLILLIAGFWLFIFRQRKILPLAILALTGATMMVWEVILIFAFQVKFGYVYQQISFLLATILTGMALGNYWATRQFKTKKQNDTKSTRFIRVVLTMILLFSFLLSTILNYTNHSLVFFFLALVAGSLTGTIFPLITQSYLKKQFQIGTFYAADLVGSFLGATLSSLFLIPLFGLTSTSCLLTLIIIPLLFLT